MGMQGETTLQGTTHVLHKDQSFFPLSHEPLSYAFSIF